jgi:hypothetical protein
LNCHMLYLLSIHQVAFRATGDSISFACPKEIEEIPARGIANLTKC